MNRAETFLVVIDDTPECRKALRLAALRAQRVGAALTLLHVIPPAEFVQWGRVQETLEAEARESAERLLEEAAAQVEALTAQKPVTHILNGKPGDAVLAFVRDNPGVRSIVLAAAAKGKPGPLVDYFTGEQAGSLPCMVMLVPGGLDEEALDRLS